LAKRLGEPLLELRGDQLPDGVEQLEHLLDVPADPRRPSVVTRRGPPGRRRLGRPVRGCLERGRPLRDRSSGRLGDEAFGCVGGLLQALTQAPEGFL
jgi:hypothetical protein